MTPRLKLNCDTCGEKIHDEPVEWRHIFDENGPRAGYEVNCCSEGCYEAVMNAECDECEKGVKQARLHQEDSGEWLCARCKYPEYQP